MSKFTKEQKQRVLKRLVRRYAHWNIIYPNDEQLRQMLDHELHRAVWAVIVKLGFRDEYFKLTRGVRSKLKKAAK